MDTDGDGQGDECDTDDDDDGNISRNRSRRYLRTMGEQKALLKIFITHCAYNFSI